MNHHTQQPHEIIFMTLTLTQAEAQTYISEVQTRTVVPASSEVPLSQLFQSVLQACQETAKGKGRNN